MIESILKNELYMGYIFGIMILGGFIREYHALEDVYSLIKRYVKDNRVIIILTLLFLVVFCLFLDELLFPHHSWMPSHLQTRSDDLPSV